MKTKFNVGQFFNQNEPKMIAMIGNISLLLALIGTTIAGLPATLEASGVHFIMPPFLVTVSHILIAVGVILKTITKLFGAVDSSGNPVNPHQ